MEKQQNKKDEIMLQKIRRKNNQVEIIEHEDENKLLSVY